MHDQRGKKKLLNRLLLLFIFAFLMSNGPGLALVNHPTLVAGVPILYLWGLGWAVVQIAIIIYAYLKVWRHEVEPEESHLAASRQEGKR